MQKKLFGGQCPKILEHFYIPQIGGSMVAKYCIIIQLNNIFMTLPLSFCFILASVAFSFYSEWKKYPEAA